MNAPVTFHAPPRRAVPAAAVAAAAAVAVSAAVAVIAVFLDAPLAAAAAEAPRRLVELGLFVTAFGTSAYMFAFSGLIGLVAVVALGRGHLAWHGGSIRIVAERALYFFAVIAASGIVDQALKHAIGRARPRLLRTDGAFHFEPFSIADVFASFPSGHATSAFAAAVALALMRPDWRGRLLGAAALVGASRVLVGAHYPSDVVGGAALGAAAALAGARVFAGRRLAFALVDGRAAVKPLRPPPRPARRRSRP